MVRRVEEDLIITRTFDKDNDNGPGPQTETWLLNGYQQKFDITRQACDCLVSVDVCQRERERKRTI